MQAGSGATTFLLSPQDVGRDVIAGFKLVSDHLSLTGSGFTPAYETGLISCASSDASGSVVLHLSAGHDVTLQGISIGQLNTSLFV
jgi:hypothetical protein